MRSRDAVLVCLNQRIERLSVTGIVQETYFVACEVSMALFCMPNTHASWSRKVSHVKIVHKLT